MPAMLGCSTVCPKCQHHFACCPPTPCCNIRRSLHALTGGGLVTALAPALVSPSACTSPQISPSAPLAFVMPPFAAPPFAATPLQPIPSTVNLLQPEARPEVELKRLASTVRALRLSGWYYEGRGYQQCHDLLKDKDVGTFLVRESSDPRFLFSLSVQTERGPTSVRIHYIDGYFRLDAQSHLQGAMPMFPSVVELVQHYVRQCQQKSKNDAQVWVDSRGKLYSPILLVKPLRKDDMTCSSLKHLARLAVHKALQGSARPRLSLLPPPHTQLELPPSLMAYLSEYPYSL